MEAEARAIQILSALQEHHNVLLYGPPGTGKSYLMTLVRQAFLDPAPPILLQETERDDFLEEMPLHERDCPQAWWITFHQSYAYEDFVVGLRTAPGTGFNLEPVQGPLLEAAEHARLEDGMSLLLIDEINRGNTSRILGEFITLMEGDKRLLPDGSVTDSTVTVRLPNVPDTGLTFDLTRTCETSPRSATADRDFTMPHHVYVLATMNSVDRSVAPLDAALRRRFFVLELDPDYDLLVNAFGLSGSPSDWATMAEGGDLEYWKKLSVRLLERINLRIRTLVGDDFQLGHAYLLPLQETDSVPEFRERLREILNRRVVPQLEEMLRGNREALAGALLAVEPGGQAGYPFRREETPAELEAVAPSPSLKIEEISPDQLETVARRLSAVGAPGATS